MFCSNTGMAKYELVYFNIKGRGESIRLLFAAAGQKYDDKRIEFAQWGGDEKKNAPQGTLPYLVINGKTKVGQSMAILRYLAREFKLYGKSNMDAMYIDQIIDTVVDLGNKGAEAMFEKDEAKKTTLMEKFTKETAPHYFDLLETCVKQSGKAGFAVGNSLTVADVTIYGGLENSMCLGIIDNYPALKANRAKVDADKNIAKYVKERPKT